MKIGFPRALYYYDYYPFWAGFFHSLGIEVITSPPSNRTILEQGLRKAHDETCLPLKILTGHIQALEGVDGIFLPRMVSVEADTYSCPKFLGIPESVLPAVPVGMPVISVTLNLRNSRRQVLKDLNVLGGQLGKRKSEIRKAYSAGQANQKKYHGSWGSHWNFEDSIREIDHGPMSHPRNGVTEKVDKNSNRLRIALAGHSYLTQESYANMNIIGKLQERAQVELIQHVEQTEIQDHLLGLHKKLFWSHAKQLFGAGVKFATDHEIDGIIYLTCFGCGTDSMIQELLGIRAREQHKPYMVVTIDEHSAEAGLITRLEAFLDMAERRKDHESNLPTYG